MEAHTWPAPLCAPTERQAFVGRGAEVRELYGLLEEARGGARRVVLLAGDAGDRQDAPLRRAGPIAPHQAGRGSRALRAASTRKTLRAVSAAGRRWLRGWSGGQSLEALAPRLGARAAEISAIVLPGVRRPVGAEPELAAAATRCSNAQRHRFFDAVAALLAEVGGGCTARARARRPALGRIRATLQLVRHLVRGPQPAPRRWFLATYREAELEADPTRCASPGRRAAPRREACGGWDIGGLGARRGGRAGRSARRRAPDAGVLLAAPCTPRPRATRSSSKRSCATCWPARESWATRRRSRRPRAGRCARGDRAAACAGSATRRATRSRWPR